MSATGQRASEDETLLIGNLITQGYSSVEKLTSSVSNLCFSSKKLNVMTINMKNGDKTAEEHRAGVEEALRLSNLKASPCKPQIIFAQEIDAPKQEKWNINTEDYEFSDKTVTSKEAGVMWSKNEFEVCEPRDVKDIITYDLLSLVIPDVFHRPKIPQRLCAVVLQHKRDKYKILAVSWHGPENKYNFQKKLQCFKYLQKYVKLLYDILSKLFDVNYVIIGGDFNLNFRTKATFNHLEIGFRFKNYVMSLGREQGGKDLIDNFLVFPSNAMEVKKIFPLDCREVHHCCESGLQYVNYSDPSNRNAKIKLQPCSQSANHKMAVVNPYVGKWVWFFNQSATKQPLEGFNGHWSWVLVDSSGDFSWLLINQPAPQRISSCIQLSRPGGSNYSLTSWLFMTYKRTVHAGCEHAVWVYVEDGFCRCLYALLEQHSNTATKNLDHDPVFAIISLAE